MSEKKEPRIDNTTIVLMIGSALLFDGGSAVPWIGVIFSILAYCTFFLWFYMKGLGVFTPKKLVAWATSILSEFGFSAVGLGVWPGITIGVVLAILISRVEDFTGITLPKKPGEMKKIARRMRQPLSKQQEAMKRVKNIQRIREERQQNTRQERTSMQDVKTKRVRASTTP